MDMDALTTMTASDREQQLRNSLQEKELLLRQAHHRAKNHLQLISSLLTLQAGATEDAYTRQRFEECRDRIKAISLLHDRLYRGRDLARIDASHYVRDLCHHLMGICDGKPDGFSIDVAVDIGPLDIDLAVPCGLIINELVSNAIHHAFTASPSQPGSPTPEVRILMTQTGDSRIDLVVADNGCGLPPGLAPENGSTLGLQLVDLLVLQLAGTLTLDRSAGTSFRVSFPLTQE